MIVSFRCKHAEGAPGLVESVKAVLREVGNATCFVSRNVRVCVAFQLQVSVAALLVEPSREALSLWLKTLTHTARTHRAWFRAHRDWFKASRLSSGKCEKPEQ